MTTQANNNFKGLILALTTAVMWGLLPLALVSVLQLMDSYTITWYRFIFSAIFAGYFLFNRKQLPWSIFKNKGTFTRLFFAAIFLALNYVLYLSSLYFVPPETAGMLIQMAPFMMLIGSVIFLKESFSRGQMVGSFVLISGLLLFFNQQFTNAGDIATEDFIYGFIIMFGAASTWAIYAIMQKKMLSQYSSSQIMWFIYVFASLFFLPFSSPLEVAGFDTLAICLLIFCCANTLIAYGTFAESLEYWPASKVSAVLAITPLLTVLFASIGTQIWPEIIKSQSLNSLAYVGACLVVTGSMLTALGNKILNKKNYRTIKRLVRL